MSRYFIVLDYNGQPFYGWQVQPNQPTVQGTIEKALKTLLNETIEVTGAGRTDTGVNARNYVAHFDSNRNDLHLDQNFVYKLNCIVPYEINFQRIALVHHDAHARFNAIKRTYRYYINLKKDPFNYKLTYKVPVLPNIDQMNVAASHLKNYRDFTSFSKLGSDVKNHLCTIYEAHWEQTTNQYIFTITADRFLRNMVRAIVGTLLDVGHGKITIDDFCKIIESHDRCLAGTSAPAQALFLESVEYPFHF
jgi:tRNA pseudouridine38-40 synthase